MEGYVFTESAMELQNPGRGFYQIYRFMITDKAVDYSRHVQELYLGDESTRLSLVEINLQAYRKGEITGAGIGNMKSLFRALGQIGKQLIVRFVYDWDGENQKYEPETIDIILNHMEQMEETLHEAAGWIFSLQGLWIGNWGEMNGTKYCSAKDWIRLAQKLYQVTAGLVFLGVRTPFQWREITGLCEVEKNFPDACPFAGRIGLYNDGMLGNESDYGTYRLQEKTRKEELEFQEKLCRHVPNGGEVICDNYYNDFENAVKDLAAMHVSYLNTGHDQKVLEKWKKVTYKGPGCFRGMDGYSYMERHLGYRFLIEKVDFGHCSDQGHVEVNVSLRNAGFAPIYTNPTARLTLRNREGNRYYFYKMNGDLCRLEGGNKSGEMTALQADVAIDRLEEGTYEVYFWLMDPNTGRQILLANEQAPAECGYHIGNIRPGSQAAI